MTERCNRVLGEFYFPGLLKWDASQADGWPALADTRWDGPNTLNLFNGRYWPYYGVKTP